MGWMSKIVGEPKREKAKKENLKKRRMMLMLLMMKKLEQASKQTYKRGRP